MSDRYYERFSALDASLLGFKRVCGYLLELPLDLDKPPWEVWVVDGLRNDRFALVTKIHHCMADGISGVSLIRKLLGRRPFEREGEPEPWTPRPAPRRAELMTAEVVRRIRAPFELLAPLRQPHEALQVPLYFLGSKLLAIYPMMPLFPNQALSVAVLSYNGDVFWGFNSDWDSLPDVHNVVEGIGAQFGELRAASSGRS